VELTERQVAVLRSFGTKRYGEHVRFCELCRETTPHVWHVRRHPTLVASACGLVTIAGATGSLWLAIAGAVLGIAWLVVRIVDREPRLACARCVGRERTRRGVYLIDPFV
jgi:hypothetical protein